MGLARIGAPPPMRRAVRRPRSGRWHASYLLFIIYYLLFIIYYLFFIIIPKVFIIHSDFLYSPS